MTSLAPYGARDSLSIGGRPRESSKVLELFVEDAAEGCTLLSRPHSPEPRPGRLVLSRAQ